MTPAQAGFIRQTALVEAWRELLENDGLTVLGIQRVRSRLDPESREFSESPALEELRLDVDIALAQRLGCALDDIPGRTDTSTIPLEWG